MMSPHLINKETLIAAVDPTHKWYKDEEINRILEITGGDLRRATTKALLGVQSRAFIQKDRNTMRDVTEKILLHEAGKLYETLEIKKQQGQK